jgi:hypothetical protein
LVFGEALYKEASAIGVYVKLLPGNGVKVGEGGKVGVGVGWLR